MARRGRAVKVVTRVKNVVRTRVLRAKATRRSGRGRHRATKEQKKTSRMNRLGHGLIQGGVFIATLVRHDSQKIRQAKGLDKIVKTGESLLDNAISPQVDVAGLNNEYTRAGAGFFILGTLVRIVGRATKIPMPKAVTELSTIGGDFLKAGAIGGVLTGGGPQSHTGNPTNMNSQRIPAQG